MVLPQSSNESANGAEYDSQEQALNNVRRVAPGQARRDHEALKEWNKEP